MVYIGQKEVVWSPPPHGYIKLNFDGGLLHDKTSAISAGIFRDHNGTPLISYSYAIPEHTGVTPYGGEINALRMGLHIARLQRINKLWIEGDAKFLIEIIEGKRLNAWYDEKVLAEIRVLLAGYSERPMISFIYREGNKAADALVKHIHKNPRECWQAFVDLPISVRKITDREARGYTYLRQARTFDRHQTWTTPTASLIC